VGTVGVNFKTRKITAGGNQLGPTFLKLLRALVGECIQVQVWDTAGQEQFHKITTSYYKGANGIMLVYDVSDKKSVENVEYWVKNIKAHASENVHVCLMGNKVDLRSSCAQNGAWVCDASFGQSFAGGLRVFH
jgi:small GTP-binding protein